MVGSTESTKHKQRILILIGVRLLRTFSRRGSGKSGWQRGRSGFVLYIFHLRILILRDVSIHTFRLSVRIGGPSFTWLRETEKAPEDGLEVGRILWMQ